MTRETRLAFWSSVSVLAKGISISAMISVDSGREIVLDNSIVSLAHFFLLLSSSQNVFARPYSNYSPQLSLRRQRLSEPEDDDDRRSLPTIAVYEAAPRTPHANLIFTFEINFKLPIKPRDLEKPRLVIVRYYCTLLFCLVAQWLFAVRLRLALM